MTKQERLDLANQVILAIAKHGREIFRHKDRIARLEIDNLGRIWFVDDYTQKKIYTHYRGRWNYRFSYGYSTQQLVQEFADFVQTGRPSLSIHWRIKYRYPEDFLLIWEVARPMFSPEAIAQLDAYLEKTSNGGKS